MSYQENTTNSIQQITVYNGTNYIITVLNKVYHRIHRIINIIAGSSGVGK